MSPDTAEVYGFGKSEEFLAEFANEGARNGLAAPIIGKCGRCYTAAQQKFHVASCHTEPTVLDCFFTYLRQSSPPHTPPLIFERLGEKLVAPRPSLSMPLLLSCHNCQ